MTDPEFSVEWMPVAFDPIFLTKNLKTMTNILANGCAFPLAKNITAMTQVSGYHADTPITIKAEASSKADSRPN